jgi:PAS domain S-box-containing protein
MEDSRIFRDNTESHYSEEALKKALIKAEDEKNKTEAIIAAMGDGISIQDTDFKILYQNQVHRDIIGDHIGEYCYNAYEGRQEVCEGCVIAGSFKDGRIHKGERSAMTDRGVVSVEVTASPVRDSSGRIIAGIEIVRDITERKKVERLIRESEEKYKNLVELTTDIIYITDNQGIQVYMNDESFRILGYASEEIIGRPWTVLIHPDDWGSSSGMFKSMMEQYIDIFNFENRYLAKDGRVLNLIHNIRVLRDEEGAIAGIQGIARDITRRKKEEEDIRRNHDLQSVFNELLRISLEEQSLQDILQQALDLIVSVSWLSLEAKGSIHLVEDEPDMLILRASKGLSVHLLEKCSRLPFGRCMCGRAALTRGIQYADCIDDRHDISYAGMEEHGHYCVPFFYAGKVSGVINLYIKKGHPRDDRESSFLKAFANVLAGIVQRKRAEDERSMLIHKLQDAFETVTRSQKEWRGTFDSITDLIFISDVNHMIIRANRAFAEYLQMTHGQVLNKKCYELFNMTELIYSASPHTTSLREQRMVQGEFVDQARGRTFLMTASPYFSQEGELVGSIISCKDVTEEKQREMRLIMSERLASLGQMASGIAHEINNPLAAIAGCTEGLLKRVGQERFEPELFRNYLKIIEEEILRCKNITAGMLSFVRKTTYDTQEVDIHKTLDKTIEIIGFQGRLKEVDLVRDYSEGLPLIRGSEGELRQVFLAIIINALDAMEDRGKLALATGVEGKNVFIKISDVGPGISPEQQSRIFDPFYTTKGEKGGTGLGLSIANKIVNNHRGRVDVSSEEGKGTTLVITLPFL